MMSVKERARSDPRDESQGPQIGLGSRASRSFLPVHMYMLDKALEEDSAIHHEDNHSDHRDESQNRPQVGLGSRASCLRANVIWTLVSVVAVWALTL